jgi:hypothetical protein
MTPEGKVKELVKRALREHHVYAFADIAGGKVAASKVAGFYYMPVAGPHSVLGIHDFVGCWNGVFWSIETKAPNEPVDATHHQKMFYIAARAGGGLSYIGVRDASVVIDLKTKVLEITHGRKIF